MTKPRGPLPELSDAQKRMFKATHPHRVEELIAHRSDLLRQLTAAGWSRRMLAQLYGVSDSNIRYWMRDRDEAKAPGYPRGRRGA